MPQGEGTYGSQVGRPSKKRTSYVNDNSWWDKLTSGIKNLRPYNPQAVVQNMKQREGKSLLTKQNKGKSSYFPKDAQHKEVAGMGIGQVTNYSYGETDRLYADRTGTLTPEEKYRAMKKKNNGT